ncbi:MAG: bifunctional 3-hydroxydecanoyl-ACP dehydratase/trans-2-decenoyl-ACP isomerase [Leptospiraceae bacterium]|nr:bifunctional 3-hydroxydecanoyl-ACP dehydratase/trans-2-decenoyl-ACP isomerase [Leptospiraceae bacterium]MDW7975375.1 bifunctional 3-hydroxydecanoyl-ACP dehydratase/trans-2-decenoyl-ACP isomerase [Leptospiraceae bacterium]
MKYHEFLQRTYFDKVELIAFSLGKLIEDPPGELAKLPAPPFLLVDRIVSIEKMGKKGKIIAEKDILLDEWFFQFHFRDDPVMPGSFGIDAIWQLIGFYSCTNGAIGVGRALGAEKIEFEGQVRPWNKIIRYEIEILRYSELREQGVAIAIADGKLFVDGTPIYSIEKARVGIFKNISYKDYPFPTQHSIGGILKK